MDFSEAVSILKKMRPVEALPPKEAPTFRFEHSRDLPFSDALAILKSIEKRTRLGFLESRAMPTSEAEAQETPLPEENAIKQPTPETQPSPDQPQPEVAGDVEIEGQKPQEFKKESAQYGEGEVVEIKPLLGIDIPSLEDADNLAQQRVSALKVQPKSKEELSRKLIDLTSALLREKDSQKRVGIKAEIDRVKNLLKGSSPDIKEELNKMFQADIQNAVNVINSALRVYKGLEDDEKLKAELKKAVLTYHSFLERLHSRIIDELGVEVPLPSYQALLSLVGEETPAQEERTPSAEGVEEHHAEASETPAEAESPQPEQEPIVFEEELQQQPQETTPEESLFQEPQTPAPEPQQSQEASIIEEVNSMREGQLLHELGAKNRKAFLSYLRGELTKEEALKMAKRLVAVEKGLSKERAEEVFS